MSDAETNKSLGYVKLFRSITEWEWFTDPPTAHLFIYLLAKANRKPTRYKGVDIPAGGLTTSREALSKATGLSEQQVRTALKHLISTNEITKSATSKFTLLIVNNWDRYQQDNQQVNQQITNNQPATNQQVTTNKKLRSKEVKKLTTTSYGDAGSDSGESDEMHDRQGMQEEPKGSVIDQVFPEYPYGIRSKLNELYIRLRHKPTAAEFEEWRKALAACHSDEERIRMIRYSLGDNQKGRTYKNLYPERGKKTKPDALPIWYDELPDQQPSRKEDVAKARRLREEILGGK